MITTSFKLIIFYWFILHLTTTTTLKYDEWSEHTSSTLPGPIYGNAIGVNPSNNTIWFLGGANGYQLLSFDYINNEFRDRGNTLPREVYGYGQNYGQIGSILYMTDAYASYINIFNMETANFTTKYTSAPNYNLDSSYSCIVSIRNEYISVLNLYVNEIFNITSHLWLDSVPSLIVGRGAASCIYINDKMFIIGGYDSYDFAHHLSSIEYLNVSRASMNNISTISWQYNVDDLPQPFAHSRCVTVNDDILVIGGRMLSDITYAHITLNTTYVIDSISGNVSLGGYLSKPVYDEAVCFVNNILYSFGGYADGGEWRGWQTIPIASTTSTTTNPITSLFNGKSTTFEPHTIPSNGITYTSDIITKTNESDDFQPSSLSPVAIAVIVSVSTVFVLCIVAFFVRMCYDRVSEKYLAQKHGQINNAMNVIDIHQHNVIDKEKRIVMDDVEEIEDAQHNTRKYKPDKEELMTVMSWLYSDVKLPIYYEIFVQNGYERLDIIREIKTETELKDIGIISRSHCIQILKAIELLNNDAAHTHGVMSQQNDERLEDTQQTKTMTHPTKTMTHHTDTAFKLQHQDEVEVTRRGTNTCKEGHNEFVESD